MTDLPVPGVTPANWGQQLNEAILGLNQSIEDQVTAEAAIRSSSVATLTADKADKGYELAGVELASAQVEYAIGTTLAVSPATAAAIVGAMINVPPTDTPVMLKYGCDIGVGVAGGGLLQLQVWQNTNGVFTVPNVTGFPVTASMLSNISGSLIPLRGRYRIGPSAVVRNYFLAVILFRDSGSSLTAAVGNAVTSPSYIRAIGL